MLTADQKQSLIQALRNTKRVLQRYRLLSAIDETHSLTKACEGVGVSYKTGWNHLQQLRQLCGQSVVDTQTGGASGGQTALSPVGMVIKDLLADHLAEQQPTDQMPGLRFSARNQLHAHILKISDDGVSSMLHLQFNKQTVLCASITHTSSSRLQLKAGDPIYAIIKASAPKVIFDPENCKALNLLKGQLLTFSRGDYETELTVKVAPDLIIVVTLPTCSHEWIKGGELHLQIAPSDIMIATPVANDYGL